MKLAIVTPWFGPDLDGGAELLAWELSRELSDRGHDVTVLTTCSRSWSDPWNKNHYSAGTTVADGITVSRFRVDHGAPATFREINRRLLSTPPSQLFPGARIVDETIESAFLQHNIVSASLLADLARNAATYDRVIFLPYLYGTTLRGWSIARERAVVIPCLHDEPYAYLDSVAMMMRGAPRLLFNSEGEFALARSLYGPSLDARSTVIGSGIRIPITSDVTGSDGPISGFVPEDTRYVLALGRHRVEKNIDLLFAAYRRFRELEPDSDLQLVLAGDALDAEIPKHPGIVALGRVSESEKWRLLKAARAVAQPSANESFSRVVMEAWAVGTPVLVHADCFATAMAVDAVGAGWKAGDLVGWQRLLHKVNAATGDELNTMGALGISHVREHASWKRVTDRLEDALAPKAAEPLESLPAIVHWLPSADYGDAVTTAALQLDSALRSQGYRSTATSSEPDMRLGALVHLASARADDDVIVRYLRKASDAQQLSRATNDHAVVVFSDLGDPQKVARICNDRKLLGASLNASVQRRLEEAQLPTTFIPPFFDDARWNVAPDASMLQALHDGRTTILTVAPVEPSSNLAEVIAIYSHYLTFDFDARLAIVGPVTDSSYEASLRDQLEHAGLDHRVMVTGTVSQAALASFYRASHIFVSHRSRYPTGTSLLEAMAFDLPICAAANEQSRSILGDSGILLTDATREIAVAALWRLLVADADVRASVLKSQRSRRSAFSRSRSLDALKPLLAKAAR